MKKSTRVALVFLSSIAIGSCGKSGNKNVTNQENDWTVHTSTNNEDSVSSYHRRTYGYWHVYPFIWHNAYRQNYGNTGKYAPGYFTKKGGFTVGNRNVSRGGFGTTFKSGSS